MQVYQKPTFQRVYKKLHGGQRSIVDDAIRQIMDNPALGTLKAGDLAGVYVHKFKMMHQLMLLAYTYEGQSITLTLLAIGSHENFYRDLKRN